MLKIIMVDDEHGIRLGLRRLLDWQALGFTIAADFADGRDALCFLRENEAHIAIVDINMPHMDGLTLVDHMRRLKDISIIILSGYDEFDYARKAMQFGVRHYLLKPVDEKELAAALAEIRDAIDRHEKKEDLMKSGEEILRKKLLEELLLFALSEEAYRAIQESFDLCGGDVRYRILALSFRDAHMPPLDFIDEHLQGGGPPGNCCKAILSQGIVYIICCEDSRGGAVTEEMAAGLCHHLSACHFQFAMALGNPVRDIKELRISKARAEQGLQDAFYAGLNKCVIMDEQREQTAHSGNILLWNDTGLHNALKLLSLEKIREEKAVLFQEFADRRSSRSMVNMVLANIVYTANSLLLDFGSSINQMHGKKIELDELFSGIYTLAEMECWFDEFCVRLVEHIRSLRMNKSFDIVCMAKEIMDSTFVSDIHLKDIASQLYISADYLGRQIRDRLGMSFNEYITQKRVEYARELLLKSNITVYEIANQCGFQSVDYFTRQFKKAFGATPNSVRKGAYRHERPSG